MKTKKLGGWKVVSALAAAAIVAVSIQGLRSDPVTNDGGTNAVVQTVGEIQPTETLSNATNLDFAEMPVDNEASGAVAKPPAPDVKLTPSAAEIVKMAQSGVTEDVMLAFVGNAGSRFNLGSDQIIYLNDLGVSVDVVKAMIQRDTPLNAAAQSAAANLAAASISPAPAEPLVDNTTLYPPADSTQQLTPVTEVVSDPNYNPDYAAADGGDASGYFDNSLQPYGNWIYVNGYGRCWQPTVCVVNHEWQPYCDRGRWVNSDCGWYWQSDYSWGWAAFHYGRWFCDDHRGWVWCPGRTWGPAWVSWRHSSDYCGWAPLPPQARFVPGIGFRFGNRDVGAGFEFGLHASHYTFVPVDRMCDYAPYRYKVSHTQVTKIYNNTKVINNVTVQNKRIINHGIDPKVVAAVSRTEIRKAIIQEMPKNGDGSVKGDRLEKSGNTLVVYRPHLPRVANGAGSDAKVRGSGTGVTIPRSPRDVGSPRSAVDNGKGQTASTVLTAPNIPKTSGSGIPQKAVMPHVSSPISSATVVPGIVKPTFTQANPVSTTPVSTIHPQMPKTVVPGSSTIVSGAGGGESALHHSTLHTIPTTVLGSGQSHNPNGTVPPNSLILSGRKYGNEPQSLASALPPVKTAMNNNFPNTASPLASVPNMNLGNQRSQAASTYNQNTSYQPLNHQTDPTTTVPLTQNPAAAAWFNRGTPATQYQNGGGQDFGGQTGNNYGRSSSGNHMASPGVPAQGGFGAGSGNYPQHNSAAAPSFSVPQPHYSAPVESHAAPAYHSQPGESHSAPVQHSAPASQPPSSGSPSSGPSRSKP
jgi:hypothetical protein